MVVVLVLIVQKLGLSWNEKVVLRSTIFFPTGAAQMLAKFAQRLESFRSVGVHSVQSSLVSQGDLLEVRGAHLDCGDGREGRLEKVFQVCKLSALFVKLFEFFTVNASLLELLDAQCSYLIVLILEQIL